MNSSQKKLQDSNIHWQIFSQHSVAISALKDVVFSLATIKQNVKKTCDLLALRFNHIDQLKNELYCKLRDNFDSVTALCLASE